MKTLMRSLPFLVVAVPIKAQEVRVDTVHQAVGRPVTLHFEDVPIFRLIPDTILGRAGWQVSKVQASGVLASHLYSPETILRNQFQLRLTPAQASIIISALEDFQATTESLQADLVASIALFASLLEAEEINEERIQQHLDQTLSTEALIKKAHLSALVRIANALTVEQRRYLDSVRGGSPLLVINEERVAWDRDTGTLGGASPGDIERLRILGIAEAVEKYGPDGAFGVVEITLRGRR